MTTRADFERRQKAMTRLSRIEDDDGSFDREFWARIDPSERMALVWATVLEMEALRDPARDRSGERVSDQPRLQRSVCRVIRGEK